MKKNRREFIKMTGLAGISLGGARILPGYSSIPIFDQEEKIDAAPEWVQKADMIVNSTWWVTDDKPDTQNSIWKGYDIELKDVPLERIVRLASGNGIKKKTEQILSVKEGTFDGTEVKGVPLLTHVPVCKTAFQQAHEQGFRVIPYLHFTDIHSFYSDQDIFLFQHPEVLLKDTNGKWVHIPMDGTDRVFRLLTCTNNPSYVQLSLAYVKKVMDWGADGVFIDNTDKRKECFANKSTKTVNPEFGPYVHEHIYPDESHNYAFGRFLESIRALVKSYGNDKIVLLNSGIGEDFQKHGDICEWESFIYGSREGKRNHSWTYIKERARQNEWYFKAGRRIMAASYLTPSREEVKDDAYWAFSAARLVDFIWRGTLKGTGAEQLYQAHMGKGLEPLKEINGLASRAFENGVIVLNDGENDQNVELTLPAGFQPKHLMDLYNGSQIIQVKNKKVKVSVPKKAARVYLLSQNL
jgi:hypothetical protein